MPNVNFVITVVLLELASKLIYAFYKMQKFMGVTTLGYRRKKAKFDIFTNMSLIFQILRRTSKLVLFKQCLLEFSAPVKFHGGILMLKIVCKLEIKDRLNR